MSENQIISYAVWLYYRFSLSRRDVEELLAERRVTVTYETIRAWCAKQAQRFLGPFGAVGDHFRTGRYLSPAIARRQLLAERRRTWREVFGLPPVA